MSLSRVALLVATGDLLTKYVAKNMLGVSTTLAEGWLALTVVHNDAGAFGWTMGSYTWQLNLALTLAAVVFVVPVTRDLAEIDKRSPVALGLIAGGALGNLASLVTSPAGVVDFIQLSFAGGRALILNVADAAAYTGLALLARTAFLIVRAIRAEHSLVHRTYVAPELRLGSLFAVKAEAKQSLRRRRAKIPNPRAVERLADDWSRVIEPVLADAPESADRPRERDGWTVRPLGVPARRRVRLEGTDGDRLDPGREIRPTS